MQSGEIGSGLTCDSQYFEIYNSQYIKILCIHNISVVGSFPYLLKADCVKLDIISWINAIAK